MSLTKQLKEMNAGVRAALSTSVALLALVAAAPSGASAAGTTSARSVVACVSHKSGTLYLAHRCARHDKRLAWNVSGPAGANGPAGASGLAGGRGSQGATGAQGPAGPFTAVLPSHQSLVGVFSAIGHATGEDRFGTAISFEIQLASAPTPNMILTGEGPTAACPGSAAAPAASPGNLCIYEARSSNVQIRSFENPITEETGGSVEPFGADIVGFTVKAGTYNESGSWAVTAP
jgi:hypothetical protein